MKNVTTMGAALCAALLSACGGGGGDGGDQAVAQLVTASAGAPVQVEPGGAVSVSGQASTTRFALTALKWSVQAKNPSAPAAVITNQDCGNATKNDRKAVNDGGQAYVSSSWQCDLSIKAGLNREPQDYTLTLTATDSAGNTSSNSTTMTVKAASSASTEPVTVSAGSSLDVVAGSTLPISCIASGGSASNGSYVWQWKQVSNPDVPLTLSSLTTSSTRFTAPAVGSPTTVDLECRATDDAGTTGKAIKSIRLLPSAGAQDQLIATAGSAQQVAPGQSVTVSAAGTAWFGPDGNRKTGPVVAYTWRQVAGPTLVLMNPAAESTSIAIPADLTERTNYTFELSATSGTASSTAQVSLTADPASSLNLGLLSPAKAATRGDAVTLWATTTASLNTSVYFAWTQVGGPPVALGGTRTASVGFVVPPDAPIGTQYVLRVSAGFKPISSAYPGIQSQDVVVTVAK